MNSIDNVIALPADKFTYANYPNLTELPWHNTNHPGYSRDVAAVLAPIAANATRVSRRTLLDELRSVDLYFKEQLVDNQKYHDRLR